MIAPAVAILSRAGGVHRRKATIALDFTMGT
jgi:hypothetical protein